MLPYNANCCWRKEIDTDKTRGEKITPIKFNLFLKFL